MKSNKNFVYQEDTVRENLKGKNSIYQKQNIGQKKRKINDIEDDVLHCYECNAVYVGECTAHKSQWILNKKITCPFTRLRADDIFSEYYNENLEITNCFCKTSSIKHIKTTLPKGFFLIKSQIENTTYGVWTRNGINRGTILGPFLGSLSNYSIINSKVSHGLEDGTDDFVWSLLPSNNVGNYNLIDARNCMTANYLRFIRRSENDDDHNLIPIQFDGKIFYQAFKDIEYHQELIVKYSVRNFRPQQSQSNIAIRVMPQRDHQQIIEERPPAEKISKTNSMDLSTDSSDIDEIDVKKFPISQSRHTIYIPRTSGFQPKVDNEMKEVLKELFLKYPGMTGTLANKKLREILPNKPFLSDRRILTIVQQNGFRPVICDKETLNLSTVNKIEKIFRDKPDLSCQEAKERFEVMYPNEAKVSYDAITQIIRNNNFVYDPNRKSRVTTEMYNFMKKILKNDPWTSVKSLNVSLKKAFPNHEILSDSYVNQVVCRKKLRPIDNARRKIDTTVKEYILQLHFNERLRSHQICRKLQYKFPKRPFISEKFINGVIESAEAEKAQRYND